MRSIKSRALAIVFVFAVTFLLTLLTRTMPAHAAAKPIHVFSHDRNFPLDVFDLDSKEYVNLSGALVSIGPITSRREGNELRLRFGATDIRLQNNDANVKVGKNQLKLDSPVVLQEGRGLVPLSSLPVLLAQVLGEPINFHPLSRRLFIGNSAVRLTTEIKKTGELALNFTQRVSPRIAADGNSLSLTFTRDGVTSTGANWKFDDPAIASAAYIEGESGPEITIAGKQPLLATFAENGRTILISAAPKAASAPAPIETAQTAPQPSAVPPPQSAPISPVPTNETEANPPSAATTPTLPASLPRNRVAVLIDAAHGGSERGAALSDTLAEKDVTLAIARRLRGELEQRGISAALLRDGDTSLSLDQRAALANSSRPGLYLAIHAGTLGRGMRLYTAMLQPADNAAGLVSWESAQSVYLNSSRSLAQRIAPQLQKRSSDSPVSVLPAPVRPLNNVATAALAIEIAPERGDADMLAKNAYQQSVASALADAIAQARPEAAQ